MIDGSFKKSKVKSGLKNILIKDLDRYYPISKFDTISSTDFLRLYGKFAKSIRDKFQSIKNSVLAIHECCVK